MSGLSEFFEAYQHAAVLCVEAAQAQVFADFHGGIGEFSGDHRLERVGGVFVMAVGDLDIAAAQAIFFQMLYNGGKGLGFAPALVCGFRRAGIAGFADDPNTQDTGDLCDCGRDPAVGGEVVENM